MLQITPKSSPQEISEYIKSLREEKGKEKETLKVINEAVSLGQDFVINLFWEEALTYQHIYMNNISDKKAILNMEQAVLKAKFYIQKYKITSWYSRLYRFLGRVSDYKNEFLKSVRLYKKAIFYSKDDFEPFRALELNGFLSYALIMSGKSKIGYDLARKIFNDFETLSTGKLLKKSDYQTWAIWRSGIVIRTIAAFIDKKLNYNKNEFGNWINKSEKDLENGDFSYRKVELGDLKQKLLKN